MMAPPSPPLRPAAALVVSFGLLASACAGSAPPGGSGAPASSTFSAQVASTDLWAGHPQRFEVGIFSSTKRNGVQVVTYGSVSLAFTDLGTSGSASPVPGVTATASYLPAPGTGTSGSGPTPTDPATARGVYQAEGVTFDRPGTWRVLVTADIAGVGRIGLTSSFPVGAEPALPAPGEPALRTRNLTLASKGVPRSAIDSRALDGPIPDPELHRWTIAGALKRHDPILVLFSTPVFCQSQFCGPSTDALETLARRYRDRAIFIHVEIWKDDQKGQVNRAAAEWLYRNGDLTEPWLFLIGADGIIRQRWGPLFDPAEVAEQLRALPPMKG